MTDETRTPLQRVSRILTPPDWWTEVDGTTVRRDAVAGLSVAVMLVPQAMAYATLAGLPAVHGLYACLVPLLAYPLLGSARQLAVGIVALDMLILGAGLVRTGAEPGTGTFVALAVLTAAVVGVIQLAMGLLRLGFLADLLSRPVITGFTAAAAVVIAASQLGPLLGVELGRSEFVHVVLGEFAGRWREVHGPTALLGGVSVALLVALRRWLPSFPAALAVVAGGIAAAWALGLEEMGVAVTGNVPTGLPRLDLGVFQPGNVMTVLPVAGTLALIQLMSAISIGRALSARHRYTIQPNRELLGLGLANLAGSLFRGVPVSASFSRSAVNDDAGARTPLANVAAAVVVGVTLLFLTPLFRLLPTAALAAIIVVSALGLVDPGRFLQTVRVHRRDGVLALLTMGATLALGIQEGVVIGVVASTLTVLYRLSRPTIVEVGMVPGTQFFRDLDRFESAEALEGIHVFRVDAAVSFFNATFFRDELLNLSDRDQGRARREVRAVVVEARGINDVDTTALDALEELVGTLRRWDVEFHLAGLKGRVRDILQRSWLADQLDEDCFHLSAYHAVQAILKRWDREDGGDRAPRFLEMTGGEGPSGAAEEGGTLA